MNDNNMDEISKSLEAHYLKGEYAEAQKLLLANKDQFDLGIFHYNLGTTLMKMGNFAAGRYHLEKALKNGYVDTKVLHNLSVAKSQLAVNDIGNSSNPLDLALSFSLDIPFSLYLSATLIFSIVALLFVRFKKVTRWYGMTFLAVLALLPILYAGIFLNRFNFALALSDTSLREGPSQIYGELSKVKAGSKFIVGENQGDWYYIKSPASMTGWVKKEDIAF